MITQAMILIPKASPMDGVLAMIPPQLALDVVLKEYLQLRLLHGSPGRRETPPSNQFTSIHEGLSRLCSSRPLWPFTA